MRQIFISDLHLQHERPDLSRAFLHFLNVTARQADQLYLLGDIFEAWIGDDSPFPGTEPILEALSALNGQGVELFFQHGNRDFLVGDSFARQTGCTLLPESLCITTADDRRLLLMHGDQLCTDDAEYQQFRQMVRDPQWQRMFLAKPVEERLAIARQIRDTSKARGREKASYITDVNAEAVEQALRDANSELLLHGHTHRPAIHQMEVDGQQGTRIVLGDWDKKGWYLDWTADGYRLIDFPIDSGA
ncbi:UDP-2,3-diacylglucosamine diphosphatase [Marinobacterium arenosum]|uniref:UDP-2,3-diacylglucosamine diphosphatase n=1 Tax=Marinobacterium arenosum TaxID=2862496 RepID=UPI001C967F8C|nr:UDP-2,3-diacylglucosamine diphosphatase [Marinobacterium arenosum]MBY4675091.1 UDP-2,3-diacylglucosamine diphosphatase [Marinobacterium arenosum]